MTSSARMASSVRKTLTSEDKLDGLDTLHQLLLTLIWYAP
jgi:hypothetical protein